MKLFVEWMTLIGEKKKTISNARHKLVRTVLAPQLGKCQFLLWTEELVYLQTHFLLCWGALKHTKKNKEVIQSKDFLFIIYCFTCNLYSKKTYGNAEKNKE